MMQKNNFIIFAFHREDNVFSQVSKS